MVVFGVEEEERPLFEHLAPAYGVEAELHREYISMGYLQSARNMDALNVLSDTVITPQMWDAAYAAGVRFAVTRCVGMAHINADYASSLGITVHNVTYSAASVADYAIMMMLMVLRNVKPMLRRYAAQNYLQQGLRGRELPGLSVGIVGAGLDVVEGDQSVYYRDHGLCDIPHRQKAILDAMPNVLMLPHLGYLTDQALVDMVENSLRAAKAWMDEEIE